MNKKRRKILSYTDHHNNEYVLYGDKDKKYTIEKNDSVLCYCYNTTDALDEMEYLFKRSIESTYSEIEWTPLGKK